MAQTLPSGIKKFDPGDQVNRAAFNENWETIDSQLAEKANKYWFNVTDYGAIGDGETNYTTAIQNAIDDAEIAGGGTVWFAPGTYRVKNLALKNNVILKGAMGSVVLKLLDDTDGQTLANVDQFDEVSVDYAGIEGIIFDGNKDKALGAVASSAVAINNCTYFRARDCVFRNATGYGLGFQALPGGPINGLQTKITLENCHFINNGDGVGGDTYDGLDIKYSDTLTMVSCTAIGNKDKGFNIRAINADIMGCKASDNAGSGFELGGNPYGLPLESRINLSDCHANNNLGGGFAFVDGHSSPPGNVYVTASNIISKGNKYGIQIPTQGTKVMLAVSSAIIINNTNHGVINSIGASNQVLLINNSIIRSNGGSGVFTAGAKTQISNCQINVNSRYGVEEGTGASRTSIDGATYVQGNTLGAFLFNTNKRYMIGRGVLDFDIGTGDQIASASTITLPEGGDMFFITGTNAISTITASRRGRLVTLHFTGVLTINHSTGNIRLNGGTNKTTANRHQLTLSSDGTSWFEVAYSANV